MRTLEFKSKIRNNQIHIPLKLQKEFKTDRDKDIRVIVFIDETDISNNLIFQEPTDVLSQKGHNEPDLLYDFFASAGLWANREIDAKELRKQA